MQRHVAVGEGLAPPIKPRFAPGEELAIFDLTLTETECNIMTLKDKTVTDVVLQN